MGAPTTPPRIKRDGASSLDGVATLDVSSNFSSSFFFGVLVLAAIVGATRASSSPPRDRDLRSFGSSSKASLRELGIAHRPPICAIGSVYPASAAARRVAGVRFSLAKFPIGRAVSLTMVDRKLFKTKLCVLYQRGHCNRQSCSFAHGQAELRRFVGGPTTAVPKVFFP
ncbi:hypothetical protein NL676_000729 [Syzygium grande]|nr:hypothetical protein NL676_000729 [Syzygium grande]